MSSRILNPPRVLLIERVQCFIVALTIFTKTVSAFCDSHGLNYIADMFSSFAMYGALAASFVVIFTRKSLLSKYFIYLLAILLVDIVLYYHQKIFCPLSKINEVLYQVFIVGLVGFTIGFALSRKIILNYIKFVGLLAVVLAIPLILEPINNSLLQLENMILGYTLVPFAIYIFLSYFSVARFRGRLFFLIVGIALSSSIILFTSRGCGISVITFIIIMLYRKGLDIKAFAFIIAGVVVLYLALMFLSAQGINVAVGSLLGKVQSNMLSSANGRDIIYTYAIELIKDNPLLGVGIGADREIIGHHLYEYPFVHSFVLEIFLNFGIPIGLLLMLLYFIPVSKSVLRNPVDEVSNLIIALVCIVWIRLFVSDSYLNNMYNIMMLLGLSLRQLNDCQVLNGIKNN